MQMREYRLSDYRLAAYVVVAAVIAGGVAFGLDRAFAPSAKVQANGAPVPAAGDSAVRQIPIARTSTADLGDPNGKLTPVYPANPGKDLPIKDTPVIQPAKPATAATTGSATTGSASIAAPPAAAPAPVAAAATSNSAPQAQTAPSANACNVEACAAAYRSFRESDCSYQPLVGARRTCEGAPGLGGPSSTGQIAATPPQYQPQPQPPQQARRQFDPRSVPTLSRDRYEDALRDAERTVRRLPRPGRFDDDDPRGVVVMESPEQRYDLRRNWVSEPGE
jgi:hypothetical protein